MKNRSAFLLRLKRKRLVMVALQLYQNLQEYPGQLLLQASKNWRVPVQKRIRKKGGGRKSKTEEYPDIKEKVMMIVESSTRGDPESSLLWTSKSVQKITTELEKLGYKICPRAVAKILKEMEYSLQANKKTQEGESHQDRNEQFEHINDKVKEFKSDGQPVISVDTKKKELVGNFKNGGREYSKKNNPTEVKSHDFQDPELGKASPYGVYDVNQNEGWVNVGISSDTSEFAVESIRQWWKTMGKERYPNATKILICADSGGSNGYRVRLWKSELFEFAKETGLEIHVSHLPPGTSKWNKIEHKMFSFISINWRAKPLISLRTIVSLIAATTTSIGLKIRCAIDNREYKKGIKISDDAFEKINILRSDFHGEWNYIILPYEKSL
jgi:transposase